MIELTVDSFGNAKGPAFAGLFHLCTEIRVHHAARALTTFDLTE